jgi:hypothetical protein
MLNLHELAHETRNTKNARAKSFVQVKHAHA